jgi:DNA-binding NarL/FixJ family response regulator
MRNNGQNIDPQESIYRYTKGNQDITIISPTGKIRKKREYKKPTPMSIKIRTMIEEGKNDIQIASELDLSLMWIRKLINKL